MAANVDIISAALRLIGVLAETETATAEQGAKGLEALNDMLAEWEADGVKLGYPPQDTLGDTFPLESFDLPVKYGLAARLADEYGRDPPPRVQMIAANSYTRLVRDAVSAELLPVDLTHMPLGERNGLYNVLD